MLIRFLLWGIYKLINNQYEKTNRSFQLQTGLIKTITQRTNSYMANLASNSINFVGCLNLDLLAITYNLQIKHYEPY